VSKLRGRKYNFENLN